MQLTHLLLSFIMLSGTAPKVTHDGHWWASILSFQRQEYLNGYMDCAIYDAGRLDLPSVSTVEIENAIQMFYDAHPQDLNINPTRVLEIVSKQKDMHHKSPRGGEVWTNKHAYYDGRYWQSSEGERMAFVQGLRDCYNALPSGPHFFRSDDYYVSHITNWYASHRKKEKTSIAIVLGLYAERKPETRSPAQTLANMQT